jgi:S-adenosylmethionine synthetase
VLPGHPDKLCDAVVDALVQWNTERDPRGQCGLEAACVFDTIVVTGRMAGQDGELTRSVLDGPLAECVRAVYRSAGYGVDAAGFRWGPDPDDLKIVADGLVKAGGFDEGERELRHLSDDQAICIGHAVRNAHTHYLPPAHWLARRIGRELHRLRLARGAGHVGPDAKVIVHGDTEARTGAFRPVLVSISLNHHAGSDWLLLRAIVEEAMETACAGMPLPDLVLNGAGMFVCGGPNGDNGLSGKKLVVDAYGPGVPIGGGAWSGKDFLKVDRLGGMTARRIALESLLASDAHAAMVTLTYLPGGDRPSRVDLLLDGRPSGNLSVPVEFEALETARLQLLLARRTGLVELARWGHQAPGMPWELPSAPTIPVETARPGDGATERTCDEQARACGSCCPSPVVLVP